MLLAYSTDASKDRSLIENPFHVLQNAGPQYHLQTPVTTSLIKSNSDLPPKSSDYRN